MSYQQFIVKMSLVKIVEEHSHSDESDVEADELTIVENALSFGDRTIEEVMTPRSVVVAVEEGAVLSPELLNELHDSGHSRFRFIQLILIMLSKISFSQAWYA